MKLTEAQRKALDRISRSIDGATSTRFATGEALRKCGLVTRETLHIVGYVYANQSGEHPQSHVSTGRPWIRHAWYLTPAGRLALDGGRADD